MDQISIKQYTSIKEMLKTYELLTVLYTENFLLQDYKSLLQEMTRGNYFQVVAHDGNKIIGVAGITVSTKIWSGRYMDMDHFIVEKSFRSKGIGKLMLAYIKKLSKQENCKILSCDVYSENFKAQRLYMNEGFVPRGFHFIHVFDENLKLADQVKKKESENN